MSNNNQDQDLEWQREHESDSLNKSVKPDKSYLEANDLCRVCHGKKRACDLPNCPQVWRDE
jgi:hypothetical protein